VRSDLVDSPEGLAQYCRDLSAARVVTIDTEFISEDSYRSELCLIQVAADGHLAVIDPLAVPDVTLFWRQLATGKQLTIVHAGREEVSFALRAAGKPPANLVDLQIAAAIVSTEFPAGYSSLVLRLLGKRLHKHETRTDWRRRPLAARQLEYAVEDVVYLEPMWNELQNRLARMNRQAWLDSEMAAWLGEVGAAATSERWRRLPGTANLSPRTLAIVRELWRWRDAEAERRNFPVRRVLRDDLIVEVARRQTDDVKQLAMVRGMERSDLRRFLPQLAACVARGLAVPPDELPRSPQPDVPPQVNVVAQLLATVLTGVCRQAEVAASLVGTVQDVRDLIAHHLGISPAAPPPRLAQGWRAEIVGHTIEDLLEGRTCIRIVDPLSEAPLALEPRPGVGK
jgi:ribonuclease D